MPLQNGTLYRLQKQLFKLLSDSRLVECCNLKNYLNEANLSCNAVWTQNAVKKYWK